MKNVINYQLIGHTKLGTPVKIPLRQEGIALQMFLEAYVIDDLVDIFCMIEYLMFEHNAARVFEGFFLTSLRLLVNIFEELSQETYFGELLKSQGLGQSKDRAVAGKNLVLPMFLK